MTVSEVAAYLRAHDKYLILTHRRPDGDTLGCAAALCAMLRQMGKTAGILYNRETTEHFESYVEQYWVADDFDYETVVSVDLAALSLFPDNAEMFKTRGDLAIDHHPSYEGFGKADPTAELRYGPNIKDWPEIAPLGDNLLLKVASYITDPVTTTDELIPSGETSSYRSNPLGLAEFTLSRKDPEYVGRAKAVQAEEKARRAGEGSAEVLAQLHKVPGCEDLTWDDVQIASTIFAVKPGDGSAREQAASCQRVLGAGANIVTEYATKRYRINWGMLPLQLVGATPFGLGDYVFIPNVREALKGDLQDIKAYVLGDSVKEFSLYMAPLTADERKILADGCLINFYKH